MKHDPSTIRFETTEGGGPIAGLGPGGGGEFQTQPPPEPEPDPNAWQGVSQEDWEAQQQALQQAQEQLQQLAPLSEVVQQMPTMGQPQQQGLGPPPDPTYDPEGFSSWLDARDAQRLGPLENMYAEQQNQEGQERAMDIISDLTAEEGKGFLIEGSAEKARNLAEEYMAGAIQQYGPGSQAAEAALAQAVDDVRNWELEVGKAYAAQQEQHLRALQTAPRELAGTGPISAQQVVTPQGGFDAVTNKYVRLNTGG